MVKVFSCQSFTRADNSFMKWLTNVLINALVPGTVQRIRIDPDYLPGLVAPKAAPFQPQKPNPPGPPAPDYEALYKRFKSRKPSKPSGRHDRGVGF